MLTTSSGIRARIVTCLLLLWRRFRDKFLPSREGVPTVSPLVAWLVQIACGDDLLAKLELLSVYFSPRGCFRYGEHVYLLQPRLALTAVNKLEKGAEEYLTNSPLSGSFLSSHSRSPEVRRAIAAIFRKTNMEENGRLMIQDINKMVEQIREESQVNTNHVSLRLALDIVGHVLLQTDLHALDGKQEKLLSSMMTILHRAYALGEITSSSLEFREAGEEFDKLTGVILQKALDAKSNEEENNRLVHLLHQSGGFQQAKENLKLFLMAGSETTASTIPFFLQLMALYQDYQAELAQEADEFLDRITRDPAVAPPLLESALKETLRVVPIAPFISRQASTDLVLGDLTIPQGTNIRIFTWSIHRSPTIWSNPYEFDSHRFIKKESQSQCWIPFGAGSRICIGQHLAWVELRLVITYLLHHFRFVKTEATPDVCFCVDWEHSVVHPRYDVILKALPRK